MTQINISNLTFSYDSSYENIFDNVSFQIDTSWKLGFTGRNGRGKTTFLKLLCNEFKYSGTISSNLKFEYFPYVLKEVNCKCIDVISEIHPEYLEWELIRELNLLELSDEILNRTFSTLSNGEQTKVLLATLFCKENNFLLIDEPTNHLDINSRKIVSKYLNSKHSFILVSHDRDFLDNCVDHILSINKNNIEIQKGNFSSWWNNKTMQDKYEIEQNEILKKEIVRLNTSARKKNEWSNISESRKIGFDPTKTEKSINRRSYEGAKSKKMMKRSKVILERTQKSIEEKELLLKNIEKIDDLKITQLKYHSKNLIELDNIAIFYGNNQICKNIKFKIELGDRINLSGKNGSGKSSILKMIMNDNIKYTGNFYKGSQLKISYVSQDTSFLKGDLKSFANNNDIDESLFKAILRKLDFSRTQFEKNIEDYSSGQKKKVLIAKSLSERAHLYIWDEPLNYIDVFSRIQIENLLKKSNCTMLFVEHDRLFCEKIQSKNYNIE